MEAVFPLVWCRRNSIPGGTGYKWVHELSRFGASAPLLRDLKMKKILIALSAVAAFSGSAFAADLAPRTYTKAPMMAQAQSWTGFYIFGGIGGGVWDANNTVLSSATLAPLTVNSRQGGDGWFGTVGAGYDWQFNSTWVFGLLADGQFGSLRGNIADPLATLTGTEKLRDTYAVGARLGYLVAPNVLSYVNGGYSGAHFGSTNFMTLAGVPAGVHLNGYNRNGWFVGGGVENNLNMFGIQSPGWFMKTEYRSAFYNAKTSNELFDVTNTLVGRDIRANTWNQTISTSLVYRFNWTGPAVGKY
jgi:outer membrane immunogenic protein